MDEEENWIDNYNQEIHGSNDVGDGYQDIDDYGRCACGDVGLSGYERGAYYQYIRISIKEFLDAMKYDIIYELSSMLMKSGFWDKSKVVTIMIGWILKLCVAWNGSWLDN